MQQRVGKQIFSISVMCSNNIGAESLESCHRGPGLPIPSLRILNLFNEYINTFKYNVLEYSKSLNTEPPTVTA